jgi:signal peptidase II
MERSSSRALLFWGIAGSIFVTDIITKWWAVQTLVPQRIPHEVVGDWLRWTLVYNRGAAFGLSFGPYSRWIFLLLTLVALVILYRLYRGAKPDDGLRVLATSLVTGGAVGNLVDRIRHDMGVVDFIDVGIGSLRWPTFNVADMAVTVGALLLAWSLWREEETPVPVKDERPGRGARVSERDPVGS